MKVLVTGATGFIGNYVVRELLKNGHHVIASSRNPDKARKYEWFPQVEYVPYDLNAIRDNVFQLLLEPEVTIHLAWEGLPNYEDLSHFERNLRANYCFLRSLLDGGLKRLVVAGTCLEYGLQNGCLSEDMATHPTTAYGFAKDTLRRALELLQLKGSFSLTWCRIFFVYGEGQSERSLWSQLQAAIRGGQRSFNMSAGEQLRDYLPVGEAAAYLVLLALKERGNGIVNVCSGAPVSVRRLVENWLSYYDYPMHLNLGHYPYQSYEPLAYWGDTTKLKNAIR